MSSLQNLFVAKLPRNLTDADLQQVFAEYKPTSAKVMLDAATGKSKGFGFVLFPSEEEGKVAYKALNKTHVTVHGHSFNLCIFPSKHDGKVAMEKSNALYIRNVPRSLSQEDVEQALSKFGELTYCAMRDDHYGGPVWVIYAEFASEEIAKSAMETLHGNKTLFNYPVPVLAKFADSEETKKERRRRREQMVQEQQQRQQQQQQQQQPQMQQQPVMTPGPFFAPGAGPNGSPVQGNNGGRAYRHYASPTGGVAGMESVQDGFAACPQNYAPYRGSDGGVAMERSPDGAYASSHHSNLSHNASNAATVSNTAVMNQHPPHTPYAAPFLNVSFPPAPASQGEQQSMVFSPMTSSLTGAASACTPLEFSFSTEMLPESALHYMPSCGGACNGGMVDHRGYSMAPNSGNMGGNNNNNNNCCCPPPPPPLLAAGHGPQAFGALHGHNSGSSVNGSNGGSNGHQINPHCPPVGSTAAAAAVVVPPPSVGAAMSAAQAAPSVSTTITTPNTTTTPDWDTTQRSGNGTYRHNPYAPVTPDASSPTSSLGSTTPMACSVQMSGSAAYAHFGTASPTQQQSSSTQQQQQQPAHHRKTASASFAHCNHTTADGGASHFLSNGVNGYHAAPAMNTA